MIRPDKCVTIVFDGKKIIKNHRIELTDGWTRSISEGATKFLGATIATSRQSIASTAKKQLEEKFSLALKSIDSRPIRGEYKVWIFRNYVVPSSRFLLTVDPISDNGIRSIQSTATKFIKRWLKLPRNATQAILFHPAALNCPHLPTERLKAKVSQLATISTSCDTKIQEITFNLSSPSFVKALHIPNEAVNILRSAPILYC